MVRESKIDWVTALLYFAMLLFGWLNIYSSSSEEGTGLLNMSTHHGRELFFIIASIALGIFVVFLDTKFMEVISYIVYGLCILGLLYVLTMKQIKGANSWIPIGSFKLQPTEFAKLGTLMALSRYMSRFNFSMDRRSDLMIGLGIVLFPMLLVLLQNDAGSALTFASMILVFYREGLHPLVLVSLFLLGVVGGLSITISDVDGYQYYIIAGIVLSAATSFFLFFRRQFLLIHIGAVLILCILPFTVNQLIKPHHSARLRVLAASAEEIEKDKDLEKVYYNLRESLVAIGSGGFSGKGYGKGTHTRGDFVPEENTDYIFCVASEEHGFLGSSLILVLFFVLIARIFYLAENSKSAYARIFGYGAAGLLFFHVLINVGMTIGLLPTVGIPLPFFSYGGSSMLSFSLILFILMNHHSHRTNVLGS